ncbi:aminotransferase class V-fold PLP-dependent enzyme [Leekyejoonella antrihumi]|uniref:Aminotransferase class V-fold PLP-dependent enzyme n=1 Tax=Leekyejoonella antrihumi TaxID=1660198 RepID=A0A563E5P9_9MICO|nr:aminotransferase class V-fold PLP-dependent enzyme [Leekyejoonella antrihumi]TWP37619.1 aminotransferase class V-fold PLP-dependent enzyme [Leekyejoonella antrihumi]
MSTAPTLTSLSCHDREPAGSQPRLTILSETRQAAPFVVQGLPQTEADDLGVPTVHRTVVDAANFDHAATTPALRTVHETVRRIQSTYGSVHRGAGYASRLTTGWFEQARDEVGRFVGARADDEVIFTRNTTDSLALLAHCLPADTLVFTWASAHHAALLAWPDRDTVRLPVPKSAVDAARLLRDALEASPATHRLVVLTGACNVTGEIWPIRELATVAHDLGARVVVDGAQLVPHRHVDLDDLGADWIAFSGHKAYAPYGAGALVGRRDWLDAASPYLPAGGATAAVTARHTHWQVGPARHEGGTPNAVGAIALASACATLAGHGRSIEAHEAALHARLRRGLGRIPGVQLVHALGADRPNVGVVTFTVDGYDTSLVSQVLSDEHGIAVRDGRFCAHLLCDAVIGEGRGAIRASIGLSTQTHHVDRLVDGVRTLVEDGPWLDYAHTDGVGWSAVGDPRDLSEPRPW